MIKYDIYIAAEIYSWQTEKMLGIFSSNVGYENIPVTQNLCFF